jgi:hypothetical protein
VNQPKALEAALSASAPLQSVTVRYSSNSPGDCKGPWGCRRRGPRPEPPFVSTKISRTFIADSFYKECDSLLSSIDQIVSLINVELCLGRIHYPDGQLQIRVCWAASSWAAASANKFWKGEDHSRHVDGHRLSLKQRIRIRILRPPSGNKDVEVTKLLKGKPVLVS